MNDDPETAEDLFRSPWSDVGDGHRYDEIWDDKGRRWICKDCNAQLGRDAIICKRVRSY